MKHNSGHVYMGISSEGIRSALNVGHTKKSGRRPDGTKMK